MGFVSAHILTLQLCLNARKAGSKYPLHLTIDFHHAGFWASIKDKYCSNFVPRQCLTWKSDVQRVSIKVQVVVKKSMVFIARMKSFNSSPAYLRSHLAVSEHGKYFKWKCKQVRISFFFPTLAFRPPFTSPFPGWDWYQPR